MSIETRVVVPQEETYKSGVGYRGPILRTLGFPEGPYTERTAQTFVQQARSVDSKKRFKIVAYVPE